MKARRVERRSQIKIIADILDAIVKVGDARVTYILTAANLSYDRLQRYLNLLLRQGLILERVENDVKIYSITKKGLDFLREFKRIEEFAKAFGIPV
ncbi:MAG: hypothetical protein DRJ32_05865 [Thermoprotei archaeon]|nr:MAG: hypothetical protein DRJ32_05865 [Thermoprotei archaeon]HDD63602.1 hypothetical protein [Thermoprotei archaeon]